MALKPFMSPVMLGKPTPTDAQIQNNMKNNLTCDSCHIDYGANVVPSIST